MALTLCVIGTGVIGFHNYEIGAWPIGDWFFILCAGCIFVMMFSHRMTGLNPPALRRPPAAMVVCATVLLTAATLSSFWAVDPTQSFFVVLRLFWLLFGWFWVFRCLMTTRQAFARVITAFRITVLINCAAAIAGNLGLMTFTPPNGADYYGREVAFYGHPNNLGALLSVGFVFFLLDLSLDDRRPRGLNRPLVRVACIAVVTLAISATGSITALGAIVLGSLTILAILRLSRGRRQPIHVEVLKRMLLLLVVLVGILWLVQSGSSLVDRLTGLVSGSDRYTEGSAESRSEFTNFVLERFDQLLVVGVGLDDETTEETQGHLMGANHNMPLKILYQAGLPALVATTVLIIVVARMGWMLFLSTRGTPLNPLAVTLIGALVVVNTLAQTQPLTYDREYWLPTAFIGALWVLRKVELTPAADRPGDPSPAGAGGRRSR